MSGPRKITLIPEGYTGSIGNTESMFFANALGIGRSELVQTFLDKVFSTVPNFSVSKVDVTDMLGGTGIGAGTFIYVSDASDDPTLTESLPALYRFNSGDLTNISSYTLILAREWFNSDKLPFSDAGFTAENVKEAILELQDFIGQIQSGLSWKEPARIFTDTNITLANEQTLQSVSLVAGDRVVVGGQTDPTENGIYDVVDAGAWTRSADADTSEELTGATVRVLEGDNIGIWQQYTVDPVIDTDDIIWDVAGVGSVPSWSDSEEGVVQKATSTEWNTATEAAEGDRDNLKGVTVRGVVAIIGLLNLVTQSQIEDFLIASDLTDIETAISDLQHAMTAVIDDISNLTTTVSNKVDKMNPANQGEYVQVGADGNPVASGDTKANLADAQAGTNNNKLISAQVLAQFLAANGVKQVVQDNLTPNSISTDFQDTGIQITSKPAGKVEVRVGGGSGVTSEEYPVSYGNRTGVFYFGVGSNGATARPEGAIQVGDHLFFNSEVAGFSIGSGNSITLAYISGIAINIEVVGGTVLSTDKNNPSATSGNEQSTGLAISNTPGGSVLVFVNGVRYNLGDGVKTTDCYFSSDSGTTAKGYASITENDVLYWNGVVAGFDLATDDVVQITYN